MKRRLALECNTFSSRSHMRSAIISK